MGFKRKLGGLGMIFFAGISLIITVFFGDFEVGNFWHRLAFIEVVIGGLLVWKG